MDLKELVEKLFQAHQKYDQLAFDEPYQGKLGKPASAEEIDAAEQKIGMKLPDDYRAFLMLHNGWTDFDGEGKLLATDDFGKAWVRDIVSEWTDIWDGEDPNPFANGAVPVMLGSDIQNFVVMTSPSASKKGVSAFELYDGMEREEIFKTFTAYLKQDYETLLEMIRDEEEGVGDDDDE